MFNVSFELVFQISLVKSWQLQNCFSAPFHDDQERKNNISFSENNKNRLPHKFDEFVTAQKKTLTCTQTVCSYKQQIWVRPNEIALTLNHLITEHLRAFFYICKWDFNIPAY